MYCFVFEQITDEKILHIDLIRYNNELQYHIKNDHITKNVFNFTLTNKIMYNND